MSTRARKRPSSGKAEKKVKKSTSYTKNALAVFCLIILPASVITYFISNEVRVKDTISVIEDIVDDGRVKPVAYSVDGGAMVFETTRIPSEPNLYNGTCGNWVPDREMYQRDEDVKQFLTCKPHGFTSKGGVEYVYTRTTHGLMPYYKSVARNH